MKPKGIMIKNFWSIDKEELLNKLETNEQGLSGQKAQAKCRN
ncbi:TPA: hypothetical protein ACGOYX_001761 [Streptococcus suis]